MSKILLLDDERAGSSLLKLSLELDGFKVVVCHTLEDAREVLDEDIDAVVVDYHLAQGKSGLTLLREIREGETCLPTHTPVIVTSGDDRCEPLAKEGNASLVLIKPYSPAKLTEHLTLMVGAVDNSA